MSQNEFINKPKNDIALSMPPLPAYHGPQESTKRVKNFPAASPRIFPKKGGVTKTGFFIEQEKVL